MSEYTYENFKSLVQDHLRDDEFTSDYTAEILRATNLALDDMNAGDTGENMPQIAFSFQKKVIDVSFVSGTIDYDMDATLGIDLNTFKFPSDHGLRVDSDEDTYFTYRTPSYFFRKEGVLSSSEKMFAITKDGGTWYLKINHSATDTLNFEYYNTSFVAVEGGSTRAAHIVNDTDKFLFADRYIGVLLNLTLNKLYGELKRFTDPEALYFLGEGRKKLKQMINSEGVKMVMPNTSMKIRGEWGMRGHRIVTN